MSFYTTAFGASPVFSQDASATGIDGPWSTTSSGNPWTSPELKSHHIVSSMPGQRVRETQIVNRSIEEEVAAIKQFIDSTTAELSPDEIMPDIPLSLIKSLWQTPAEGVPPVVGADPPPKQFFTASRISPELSFPALYFPSQGNVSGSDTMPNLPQIPMGISQPSIIPAHIHNGTGFGMDQSTKWPTTQSAPWPTTQSTPWPTAQSTPWPTVQSTPWPTTHPTASQLNTQLPYPLQPAPQTAPVYIKASLPTRPQSGPSAPQWQETTTLYDSTTLASRKTPREDQGNALSGPVRQAKKAHKLDVLAAAGGGNGAMASNSSAPKKQRRKRTKNFNGPPEVMAKFTEEERQALKRATDQERNSEESLYCTFPQCEGGTRHHDASSRDRHIREVHCKMNVVECPHCGAVFVRKANTKRHLEKCMVRREGQGESGTAEPSALGGRRSSAKDQWRLDIEYL